MSPTRRTVLGMLLESLLPGVFACGAPNVSPWNPARLIPNGPDCVSQIQSRRYRVHAMVSVFAIPVISKEGVGAACAMVEQIGQGPTLTTVLQFAAGSWPERAAGLNRFGMTQEVVREKSATVEDSAYVSFITNSPERRWDQARSAFATRMRALILSVARGTATAGGHTSQVEHVEVPAEITWMDAPRLIEGFRQGRWDHSGPPSTFPAASAFPTFLFAVRGAMTAGAPYARRQFIHNGELHTLHAILTPERDAMILAGRITGRHDRPESEFRAWFDPREASGLPTRIDFRPRNFLRLVFEHDPSADGPALSSLTSQEGA